jgi:hypothetical protein
MDQGRVQACPVREERYVWLMSVGQQYRRRRFVGVRFVRRIRGVLVGDVLGVRR